MHPNERLIPESQLEAVVEEKVKQILAEMLGVTQQRSRQEWFETNDAWSLLDLKNAEDLRRKRRNGFFKLGYHYRKGNEDPGATMPRWEFHVPRCQERLAEDPAKWMKPRRSEA
ncbi:hypothetical protein ACQ4M3_34340 [Leptolyngbya sp. AN03gr2]|uniref:hypothetical protein n=1 Tax=unclassified Leptolyngbya TaxID=2650499 RepID=UPI003D321510